MLYRPPEMASWWRIAGVAPVVVAAFLFGCGGGDGDDRAKASMLCKAQLALLCNRIFTCPGRAEMQTTYVSEEDCNAKTSPSCDGATTCVSGTYHADKDQQCLDAKTAMTCTDVEAPPVCREVCTTS